jgi:hypothetical protein
MMLTACAGLIMSAGALVATTTIADAAKARSAKSMECSKEADTQKLHGKARKTFRGKCMRDKSA